MPRPTLDIAIVGTGIAGLSAAWQLSQHHRVTVFEQANRTGGHANTRQVTLDGRDTGVDTGFVVYNERNYPNLVALFQHLDVPTQASNMSFAVSLDGGRLEYSSNLPRGLFGQPSNIARPRFWSMLADLRRFYAAAPADLAAGALIGLSLGQYLSQGSYGRTFIDDHLLPMGAAIWSSSAEDMRAYPAEAFVRFFESHGLLELRSRPTWRTVTGGSRTYVDRLTAPFADRIHRNLGVAAVTRHPAGVSITDSAGRSHAFDHAVIATHADDALRLLRDPSAEESALLGAIPYTRNHTYLHKDPTQMPRRRAVWASWNYVTRPGAGAPSPDAPPQVSYWLNRLHDLNAREDVFITLNPARAPEPSKTLAAFVYDHPMFDSGALAAQPELWSLQGVRNTWFAGSYFGYGFHEDALQSGLAVGEALGGHERPWSLPDPSSRIHVSAGDAAANLAKYAVAAE
ncbi:MAG: FAD-dependent oxidoreductase [Proteobacteria bacterium]|nr:FAD-dependent oxidoreductase [Pseudomonadota bacterium]